MSSSRATPTGFWDSRGNPHTHSRMTPTGSPEGWKWVLRRKIPVSQQPGRSLPVTGLPLKNLADLGGPASKLPCVGRKIERTEISVRFHPWGAHTLTHRTSVPRESQNPVGVAQGVCIDRKVRTVTTDWHRQTTHFWAKKVLTRHSRYTAVHVP
jgi:hypothetical protein